MANSAPETDPVMRNLMDTVYNSSNTNNTHLAPNGLKQTESSFLSSMSVPHPPPPPTPRPRRMALASSGRARTRPPPQPMVRPSTARVPSRPPSRISKQTSSFHTLMKQEEIRHHRQILEIRRVHEGPKETTERNMLAISQLPEFQKHAIPMRNYMFNKILVGYADNKQIAGHIINRDRLAELEARILQDEQNLRHCLSIIIDSRVDVRQLAWDYIHSRAREEARKLWNEVRNIPTLLKAVDDMLFLEAQPTDLTSTGIPGFPTLFEGNSNLNNNDNDDDENANVEANANEPFMWEPPPIPPMY